MRKFYLLILLWFIFFGNIFSEHSTVSKKWVLEKIKIPVKIEVVDSNKLIVENLPKETLISIYSIVGIKVLTLKAKAGSNEFKLDLPKGYYILKTDEIVKKIAIK